MEGTIGCAVIFGVLILILVLYDQDAKRKQRELESALDSYNKELTNLKRNPNNPNIRQKALQLGRTYSNLTRDKKGVTIYDEMALMNDINAACAGATIVEPKIKMETKQTIEQRIEKLSELKNRNLISEREYDERRQKILDEI